MKKILIPRKDHEVYFISLPETMNKEQRQSYITEQLHILHPGFSSSALTDIQELTIDTKAWIMATVMEQNTITEYRILHPHKAFFTHTSLLVRQPDFINQPIHTFSSERIGFDNDTKRPVSQPLPKSKAENDSPEDQEMLSMLLKKTPLRYGVFKKHRSPLLLIIPLVLMMLILGIIYISQNITTEINSNVVTETAPVKPLQLIPPPVSILADISRLILEHGGMIQQWEYNEVTLPAIKVHIEGSDAGLISGKIRELDYLFVSSVSDIQYNQNSPQYSLSLSFNSEKYRPPVSTAFNGMDAVFPILHLVRETCSLTNTIIVSELLSSQAQNNTITINLESPAEGFVQTLEQLEQILTEKALWIQQMHVGMNPAKDTFLWSCSLIPYRPEEHGDFMPYDKHAIPSSFGYKPPIIPPPAPRQFIPVISAEPSDAHKKIGTIYEGDKSKTIFYRNNEGKIIMQEE